MHVHLLVPDLLRKDFLAPDPKSFAASPGDTAPPALPSAALLLARGRRKTLAGGAYAWLAERHALQDGALTAAISLLGDGGSPDTPGTPGTSGTSGMAHWLRADPVQLSVDRDALVLADASVFTLTAAEAASLAQTVNAHFGPALNFDVVTPLRWYTRIDAAPDLRWTSVREARGQAIPKNLPQGTQAMHWNAIANEVQMLLHEHPVNVAREARGEPMINSLWFWGAGCLATPTKRAFGQVYAEDPVARGLAMAAGGSAATLPATADEWLRGSTGSAGSADPHTAGLVLFVLDGLAAPAAYAERGQWAEQAARIERDWLAPLLAALRGGRIGMLTLALPGHDADAGGVEVPGVEVEIVRGDLRRFWRRARPLTHYLAEAKV